MSTNTEQRLQQQCDDLMIRLSASQAREAELREKLEAETNLKNLYRGELEQTADQRNELAKKLAEAESNWCGNCQRIQEYKQRAEAAEARIKASQEQVPMDENVIASLLICGSLPNLFATPVIPPELAELQRENAALRKKLSDGYTAVAAGINADLSQQVTELRKLLEEAKSKAVPEGCPFCGGTSGHWEGCSAPAQPKEPK